VHTIDCARGDHAAGVEEVRGAVQRPVPEEERTSTRVSHPVVRVHSHLTAVPASQLPGTRTAAVGHA
jgi:hypothetical protein